MKSRIAIITVVYNNAATIFDALQSVRAQQEIGVEHIIIDGGSTDGTLKLIKQWAPSSTVLISEPDRGIYDAMNKGLRLATSDIVGFLNSDDVYFDHRVLKRIKTVFDSHPAIQIVYGDLVYVQKNNLSQTVRIWKSKPYYDLFFEEGNVPPHPAFFVRRTTLTQSGGFDLTYSLAADYELMFRLLKVKQCPSLYLPHTLVKMRLGGKTNQSLKNIVIGNKEIIQTWEKHRLRIPLKFWVRRYFLKLKQYALVFFEKKMHDKS